MISENDREWSLECKLGTSTGNFTTVFGLNRNDELKKGRFVYDKISKRFTNFHYDANHELREQVVFFNEFGPNSSFFKAQFGVHQAYKGTSFCANEDDYRIKVGNPRELEIQIVDLSNSDREQLHQLLHRELGCIHLKNSHFLPIKHFN